jgi:hypothetical protein
MTWSGIIGYTLDNMIFFDGLISFLIGIVLSFILIFEWLFTSSSVVFWLFKNTQKRSFEILEAVMIFNGELNLLTAVRYSNCFISSIIGRTMAWFIFGVFWCAVVSAKLLGFELSVMLAWLLCDELVGWFEFVLIRVLLNDFKDDTSSLSLIVRVCCVF